MLKNRIRIFLLFTILILILSKSSFAQGNYPKIYSPLYEIEDNIKIISDSILLNGYLVFEYNSFNKELGFDKSKKYFTFITYFVLDLDDIKSSNSAKFYYNSNKILYKFYYFSENSNSDTLKLVEKERFKRLYQLYLQNLRGTEKPFMIEYLDFNIFSKVNTNFFQLDTLNKKGCFIFKCKLSAFLFISQTRNIIENNDQNEKISMLYFEPLSNSTIFKSIDDSIAFSKGFKMSNWIWDYLEH